MDITSEIRQFYDSTVEAEWGRIENQPEFLLTTRFMSRYIKPGDKVLDIGGGPGRYSLWLAGIGCDVTLFDLSGENVSFATDKAAELGLKIKAFEGDARHVDEVVPGQFDHVLIMGPLYHILDEPGRIQAVSAALNLLKPGGTLFASFISVFAGMIFVMRDAPEVILSEDENVYYQAVLEDRSYAGPAFTQAFLANKNEILPFMAQFPLDKLHFFGQEGILAPCRDKIMASEQPIIDAWLDFAEQLAEREDLLNYAEHLMYVGKKKA